MVAPHAFPWDPDRQHDLSGIAIVLALGLSASAGFVLGLDVLLTRGRRRLAALPLLAVPFLLAARILFWMLTCLA